MKFRFCGDSDCPEWILAEIHSTLSTLTSIKLKILTQEVAKSFHQNELQNENKILEMFETFKDNGRSAKSAVACVRFMLLNATRYNTDEVTFGTELQQLGLPKELSQILCRAHAENSSKIREYLLTEKIMVHELNSVTGKISKDAIDCALLEIKIKDEIINGHPINSIHNINIHKSDLSILMKNLKQSQALMEKYDFEKKYKDGAP